MADDELAITVTGLEETMRDLDVTTKKINLAKALTAAAVPIVNELRLRTPQSGEALMNALRSLGVSPRSGKYGTLLSNLRTRIFIDQNGAGGAAVIDYDKMSHVARWVEYGHRIVAPGGRYVDNQGRSRKGTETGFVPAHPFIRPAREIALPKALDAFEESIDISLRDEVA